MFIQALTVPVLAEIQSRYDTTQATVTWVVTAYLLTTSVTTPIAGRVGDVIGKNRALVFCLAAITVGSAIAVFAPTIGWLITARVIQGVGGGAVPLAYSILRDESASDLLTRRIGRLASVTALGYAGGIVLAGPVLEFLGYRWLFLLPLIVTIPAFAGALLVVPLSPIRSPMPLRLLPATLLAVSLVSILLGISRGPQSGWTSAPTITLIVGGLIIGIVWGESERRATYPLVDIRMMARRSVWTTNLVSMLVGVGLFAGFAFTPIFNQTPSSFGFGFGVSVTVAGLMTLPSASGNFVAGFISGRLGERFGARSVTVVACLLTSIGFFLQAYWHDHIWQMLISNGICGIGFGLLLACLAVLIVNAVPPDQTGVASGMNANVRGIGGAVGTALVSTVILAHSTPSGAPTEQGFSLGFLAIAACSLAAAVAALAIPACPRRTLPAHPSWSDTAAVVREA